jgi:hypothetical protein
VPVECQSLGSARDRASRYSASMRTIIATVTLSLAFTFSCGEDEAPKRPEDGTVKAWEACAWDGQVLPQLCKSDLACTSHGVCAPTCMTADDCPVFDGFENECSVNQEELLCRPRCNANEECPKTGGVELHCLDFYCVGDS